MNPWSFGDILRRKTLSHAAHDSELVIGIEIHVCIVFLGEDQMVFAAVHGGVLALKIALFDKVIDLVGGV
jgi:hypothetical protein